ncbi:hypothetical protein BDQ12DRAFT_702865 [Crucibulum laeve]|uniref:Ras-GAP domain-containing protein n=1 Tax=Crucibulum laeve TaxID=68775 RepID=A0A5C3MG87_9AGAR|nr:hypothetical protein BDQ12DRAFT_702865 [Crucibulum laeve]
MPIRRPSASVGPPQTASNASSTRVHKSSESHYGHGGMAPIQQHSLLSLGASATPQQKIVQVLVNRLKNKLPCNSGTSLDRLEGDSATQQAIMALVELSHDSLDMIAWALSELLDRLAKQTDNTGHLTIEVLQSQLFILKVLSMTMASRWSHNPRSNSRSSNHPPSSIPDSPIMSGASITSGKRGRGAPSEHSSNIPTLSEPPPMEDNCAKYILSVMVLFLRQTASSEVPLMLSTRSTDITFRDFETLDPANIAGQAVDVDASTADAGIPQKPSERILRPQPSSSSVRSGRLSINSTIHIPAASTAYERTHMSLVKSTLAVNRLIAKYAGRIIFHISASNWGVVFNRLRTKIRFIANNSQDNPDIVDLQLMAHSVFDRQRLVQLMNDLSSLLVSMDKEAQSAIVVPMRAAIWNWIDLFPGEFNDAIRTRGRTEGAPERLFDLLYSMNPTGNERIFWPTLSILNCMTTDRISADFSQYTIAQKTSRKDVKFGEDVFRHAGTSSKLSEVSLACAVDTCKAAMYVSTGGEVPLRLIAFDVAHEIKGALSNKTIGRKAFWEAEEEIDIALFAEALVALYRFLPPEDSIPLFIVCVDPERSEAVKTCAVRACLTLIQEASRFAWQRSLEPIQVAISDRFREVLKTASTRRPEVDQFGNMKRAASRPKAKRTTPEPLSDREILLLGILSLWRASPTFFMNGVTQEQLESWITSASKMWDAPIDMTVKVSISSCLRSVGQLAYNTSPADPNHEAMITLMKMALPVTLISVASNLLSARTDLEGQRMWISICHQSLELYVRKTDMEHVKRMQYDSDRIPAFAMIEIAFLVSLTSADSNVSQLAARGLRFLAHAERHPDAPVNTYVTDEEKSKRNPIYEQLGDPRIVVVGRLGQQKRVRKLVRLLSYSSGMHIAVWEECFWRWRSVTESISEILDQNVEEGDSYAPVLQQDLRFQWQNLTLFLTALSGACVQECHNLNGLAKIIPAKYLPDKMRAMQDPVPLVDSFMIDLINCLVTTDVQMREVARDALGTELSPRLYAKLLKNLDDTMHKIEERAGSELTDEYVIFLDQFIAVLKLLVESSHAASEDVMSIEISSIMLSLANFIARFDGPSSYRAKIKYCVLCESVCGQTDTLMLKKDSSARHNILDTILEWVQPDYDRTGDVALVCNELNLACLRTTVKLLERLELRLRPSPTASDDSLHFMSRLFNKYASALLQSLDACQPEVAASDSVSDIGSMQQKMRVSQREAEIRELVITGLSHLVISNSEIGFKSCLSLAYDQDNRKRAIFAHVFARVIGEGTKFDAAEVPATQSKHARLCELVRGSDMILAITICEVCPPSEVEMMISVLLNIFDTRSSLLSLLKLMIDREIAQTENEAALFRSNSTCMRFISAFARIHGYNYLRELVQPLIKIIEELPPGSAFEVDTSRVPEEDAVKNKQTVEYVASRFLTVVTVSTPSVPLMFREVCNHIGRVVTKIWPGSKFPAIGAFVFLRFISPAVVSPEIVDVELPKGDNTVIRRGLMVTAKILQNLANNIFFGKEAHMTVYNDFLHSNITNITRFLSELQKIPGTTAEEEEDQWLGITSDETDIIVLHRFFDKHADKIGKELLSITKSSTDDESSVVSGKRAWDGLCALLVDLGPVIEAPRLSAEISATHQEYNNLMIRYANRNTESVHHIFLETDVEDDTSVFVLRLSKIDVESLDIELLMYYIFKILELPHYKDQHFQVIVDCTSFAPMSEVPLQWLKFAVELIPSDIRARFSATHILNPNVLAQKYLRRLYNIAAGTQVCGEIKVHTSVRQVVEYVSKEALVALEYPLSLEQEPHETFTEIKWKVSQLRFPVTMEVGATHLRVTSVKKQPISPGLSCKSTEIIPLADVSDVYNVSTGNEVHEFIIRRRQGVTIYFTSPAREIIVKTIRSAKGRLKEVQTPMAERFSRFSNVPATLLHIGLLSIDLNDEELRGAAYDLLGAVCTYLKYDKSPIITSKAGFIPGDPHAFTIQLSEKVAEFAPQLTLDFIHEVSAAMTGMAESAMALRINCLQYISPWIRNLAHFANPTHALFERSGARLRDCIRTLSELSVQFPDITSTIQKYIWCEVSKLDVSISDVILDELVRSATDGGIGTRRCEAVAHIVGALSSINVRGKIYSKLKKALSKQAPEVTNTLTDHPNWNEISSLIRLALVVGSHSRQPSNHQLFVPEIAHLVTLVAGEGPTLVRKSVYGIVMNLLQSLYITRTEETPNPELRQLIDECTTPETLKLFGLLRETPTSEYVNLDPANDKEALDIQERLSQLLIRIMDSTSGTRGLYNVWRARWMSLVTSTAFQLSPAVQMRSFSSLSTLAISDVDDDYIYQILVAFKTGLSKADETHTMSVVSMLRCICKLVPALEEQSKYVCPFFWLAVALLQSSHIAFYVDATALLRITLDTMEARGMFANESVSTVLLEGRSFLSTPSQQLDELLRLSFETNFSFSLASIIFKGLRHSGLKDAAESVLRSLLCVTVRSYEATSNVPNGFKDSICPDALGYFLALIPVSVTTASYRRLLKDCHIDEAWYPDAGLPDLDTDESGVPRVSPVFLGINDSNTALLATSFVGTILSTAQGDDVETEMLFSLLSEMATSFPDTVSICYESMQDRIRDTFGNASNPSIIESVTNIFGTALQDNPRVGGTHRGTASTSSINTGEDSTLGATRHAAALSELGMQGLATTFQFLPPNRGHATKMIHWIPELVTAMIM